MRLSDLFEGAPKTEIQTIMTDSRVKSERAVFFCIRGAVSDGHRFISQAKENGAVAVVHSEDLAEKDSGLVYIRVEDVLETLNLVSVRFFGNCSRKMTVFGVTGTNGKSTVSTIIRNVMNSVKPCGYIGTIGIVYNDVFRQADLTTPDIVPLHRTFEKMYDAGMEACAMEVSSSGLALHRVDAIDFDYAIFTNLTHDHLDFHGTMENYFLAKRRLFVNLPKEKTAIINIDDMYGRELVSDDEISCRIVTYAINQPAVYQATRINLYAEKTTFVLKYEEKEYEVTTNLAAKFNVYNLLAVIAALHENGWEMEDILTRVKELPQVSGRMERVDEKQPFTVIVDYAHTPDGLQQIFDYAKHITPEGKRLISVFGSAGKRDVKKRVVFGELADRYCDLIILTEDDPRNEDPQDIANEIASGIQDTTYLFIESRYDAIRQAIEVANTGDVVVILGKGDDPYMAREYGKEEWMGDQAAAREVIRKYYYGNEENEHEEE